VVPPQEPHLTGSSSSNGEANAAHQIGLTEIPPSLGSTQSIVGELSLPVEQAAQVEKHNLMLSSENLPILEEELSSIVTNGSRTTEVREDTGSDFFKDPFKPGSQEDTSVSEMSFEVVRVSVPDDQGTWTVSDRDEKRILDWARTVFSTNGRSDLLASWDSARLGEAFLELNVLLERIQWIVPVQVAKDTVGMIGIEPSGEFGWINPSHGDSIRESLNKAETALERSLGSPLEHQPKLLLLEGRHYWLFNTSLGQYLIDVLSYSPAEMTLVEARDEARDGAFAQPRAQGNTQMQPDTAPWFHQGGKSWCGPYSTTMVLAWWGDVTAITDHDQRAYDVARVSQNKNPPDPNQGSWIGTLHYAVDKLTNFKTLWHGEMRTIWSSDDGSPRERNDIKDWIRFGYPVIIEVDVDGSPTTKNDLHVSTVIGYDDSTSTVYVHDPSGAWTWFGGDTWASYTNLEKRWGAWDNHDSCWPFGCYGFQDKDTPNDWFPHYHKHLGFVMYPGDWILTSPSVSSSALPSHIYDDEVVTFTVSLRTSLQDAGNSGIHVRVLGGEIVGYATPHFSAQAYGLDANPISLPAPVVEFSTSPLSSGTTSEATLYIEPIDVGAMTIRYRGWATDLDDKVHCNYDFAKVNPWQTRLHTVSVSDDSSSSPISMPSVEHWVARDPSSWADDRWDEDSFTSYETYSKSMTVD
ncbi:MAG: C39 family peptidase, partial [Thermoplasmata archaeon]|nr:C39 family peptidase [Thermoplasmata archaeon]